MQVYAQLFKKEIKIKIQTHDSTQKDHQSDYKSVTKTHI